MHGFEYAITGAKTEGILPMQWRTGHIMYGYKNTPTPAGWFYVSDIELETFVKLSAITEAPLSANYFASAERNNR